MLLSALALLLLGQACVAVEEPGTIGMGIPMYDPVCAYACHDALSSLYLSCTTFDGSMEGMDMKLRKRMDMGSAKGTTSSACRANNTVWLQTYSYCIHANCLADGVSESRMEVSWKTLAADGDAVPELKSVLPSRAPTVQVDAEAMWLNETQLVNRDVYFANRQTLQEFAYSEIMHVRYGVVIMAVTVGCFLLGGAYVAITSSKSGSMVPVFISKYITLPALLSTRHQVALPFNIGYVPSRGLSIFIFFYVALNIILCSVSYKSVMPNTYSTWFATLRLEVSSYVANRTGILCIANLALAILFAGRNNPVMWCAGFSQTTSLTFHRWAARVSTVQAVIHSIIYTYTYIVDGGSAAAYAAIAAQAFYWWGILATIALAITVTVSVLPIRLRFYDSFLLIHIVLAILALLGTWYHVHLRFYNRWGYKTWIYISFAFWLFDRLMRFARVMFYNWVGGKTEGFAELLPGGELIKLTVFPGRSWNFKPGQHSFLYFPGIGYMWENHPFSIASWTSTSSTPAPIVTKPEVERSDSLEKESKPEITTASVHSTQSAPIPSQPAARTSSSLRPAITFIIRPHKGATKALHKYLSARGPGSHPIEVLTEGPYGHTANLQHFNRVLCIGGGIGVTALLPYVQSFVSRPAGNKQGMMLAWTAKEPELVSAVRNMIPATAESAGLEEHMGVTHGEEERMDISAVVSGEVGKVGKGGRLAVVVCGPAALADQVRRAVVECVGVDGVGISLFEESFTW